MGILASVARALRRASGVAAGVNQLFQAADFDIPHSGLVLQPRTVVIALAVGIVVTLLSAVIPAQRATRVPPMAALQEGAALPPSRFARFMPVAGRRGRRPRRRCSSSAGMYGPGGTMVAARHHRLRRRARLRRRGHRQPLLRRAARRAALGWPLQKLAPVSGRLARDNSRRNPSRTARRRRRS